MTGSEDTCGEPPQLFAVTPRFQKRTAEHYFPLAKRNPVRKNPQQNLGFCRCGDAPRGGVSRVLTCATVTYKISKYAKKK